MVAMVVVKVAVVVAAVMVRQEATKAWDSDSNRPVDPGHDHLYIKLPWRAVPGNTPLHTQTTPTRSPPNARLFREADGKGNSLLPRIETACLTT